MTLLKIYFMINLVIMICNYIILFFKGSCEMKYEMSYKSMMFKVMYFGSAFVVGLTIALPLNIYSFVAYYIEELTHTEFSKLLRASEYWLGIRFHEDKG